MNMKNILQLPTELLHLLTEYELDLTTLRLVCRHFNTAFLDIYAKHYLSDIQCFVLEQVRLERLENVLLTGHLSRHVNTITLSLDPLEGKPSKEIPVALLPHFEDQFEIGQVLARMCMLESKFEPYMQQAPPINTIATVLQYLQRAKTPNIILDCRMQTLGLSQDLRQTIERNADQITLNILQTLCLSPCRISALRLSNTVFLDRFVDGKGHRNGLTQYCSSLKALSYEADLADLIRVFGNSARNEMPQLHSEWGLLTVLQGASCSLQELDLTGPFDPRRVRSQTSMDFANAVLRSCQDATLRKVSFTTIQCDVQTFQRALGAWKHSLEDLYLDAVSLETDQDFPKGLGWLTTFEILSDCSRLTKLHLDTLYERESTGDASPSLDLRASRTRAVSEILDISGAVPIQEAMRCNIEAGCTFSYKIKSRLIRDRTGDEYEA